VAVAGRYGLDSALRQGADQPVARRQRGGCAWRISVRQKACCFVPCLAAQGPRNLKRSACSRCLFQGQGATLGFARGGGFRAIVEPAGPTEVEVTVAYRGTYDTQYATRVEATKESGRAWAYTADEVG
jgi:hypothetical protein